MGAIDDYVMVFESTDGGSGKPEKTFWQFLMGNGNFPVTTDNPLLAETMRLAVETSSKVRATYSDSSPHVMSQARIEFQYVCHSRKIERCIPGQPDSPKEICETIRFAPCKTDEATVQG